MNTVQLMELDKIRELERQLRDQERRIDLAITRIQWLEQRVKELEKETV